jgi:hypothetical protein
MEEVAQEKNQIFHNSLACLPEAFENILQPAAKENTE